MSRKNAKLSKKILNYYSIKSREKKQYDKIMTKKLKIKQGIFHF